MLIKHPVLTPGEARRLFGERGRFFQSGPSPSAVFFIRSVNWVMQILYESGICWKGSALPERDDLTEVSSLSPCLIESVAKA